MEPSRLFVLYRGQRQDRESGPRKSIMMDVVSLEFAFLIDNAAANPKEANSPQSYRDHWESRSSG